jgi:cytochrome c biogenesis protein
MRAKPVITPRNLARLPHHAQSTVDVPVDEVLAAVERRLRGWRRVRRDEEDGARSVSAERGYLRETGNLVFHFALLGLLVSFALGKMYGYDGQVIVQANGSQFCNAGLYNYDSYHAGLRVDGTQLDPFCVKVDDFTASYLPNGQADHFESHIEYQSGADLDSGTWRPYDLQVNSPLRTAGDRVYLLGHGYTPKFTVTFPNGQQRSAATQWKPADPVTLLSEGATKFDPPQVTDEQQRRKGQIGITGLFAPSAVFPNGILTSNFPDLRDPAVAIDVYQGDLGVDSGRGQSIFSLDLNQVDRGVLKKVARWNLKVGESKTLDDGTKITFSGVDQWVSLQVAHDPTQVWVLVFALLIILGLGTSLVVKRRRIWVRVTPAGDGDDTGRTVVEIGGLARPDPAGYGEEFTRLAGELLAVRPTAASVVVTRGGKGS